MEITKGFFKGKCLTAIGKSEWETMRWDGSAALKKSIINDASFSFISLEKPEDYAKHEAALNTQKVRNMLLDCSDAHHYSDSLEKDRIGNSFTWLKSDTTFEGLKQAANDNARICIAEQPTLITRYEANKTKFIKTLSIEKVPGSVLTEVWFDKFELPLNPSMVAIIGNKGNGKSAIADVIGLVGNTPNYDYFSFLNKDKFRKKHPINKSEHYQAKITWADDTEDVKRLNENPESTKVEKVKYIPQGFLEKLCNDDIDDFEKELRQVIFSHLPEEQRLGKANLNELINYKTEIIDEEIETIKKELLTTNKALVELETKSSEEFKKAIIEKIQEKENELNAHNLTKPNVVEAPSDPAIVEKNKVISESIEKKRRELDKTDENIKAKQNFLKIANVDNAELEKVIQSVVIFENSYQKLKVEITPVLEKSNLRFEDIASIKIDKTNLDRLIQEKRLLIDNTQKELNDSGEGSLTFIKKGLQKEIKELQLQLDDYSKKFQEYIDNLKIWDEKKLALTGDEQKEGTITFLKSQLAYLETELSKDIEHTYNTRLHLLESLFLKKEAALSLYKSLFKPVSDFINAYGGVLENYQINLDVDYKITGLIEKFSTT
jgi:hypothetical protein